MTKEEAIKFLELDKKDRGKCFISDALNMAIKALEQPTSDDCVSRQALINSYNVIETPVGYRKVVDMQVIEDLPPVTPTQCIGVVRFSKEDLREICNERIEVECTHGTCRDCKNGFQTSFCSSSVYGCEIHKGVYRDDFYCADFEMRGDSDGKN